MVGIGDGGPRFCPLCSLYMIGGYVAMGYFDA